MSFNQDFVDFLDTVSEAEVEFVLVGAHAMAAHGVPRATGDIDVFVRASRANARRIYAALVAFGAPLAQHRITAADFEHPGDVYQMGLPPRRIDLLTEIDGVPFAQAWKNRKMLSYEGRRLPVLSVADLIVNKRASGRPKDLVDLELLRAAGLLPKSEP